MTSAYRRCPRLIDYAEDPALDAETRGSAFRHGQASPDDAAGRICCLAELVSRTTARKTKLPEAFSRFFRAMIVLILNARLKRAAKLKVPSHDEKPLPSGD